MGRVFGKISWGVLVFCVAMPFVGCVVQEQASAPVMALDRVQILDTPPAEDFVGVVANYLAGVIAEEDGHYADAGDFYSRVDAVDGQNVEVKERSFLYSLAGGDIPRAMALAEDLKDVEGTSAITRVLLLQKMALAGDIDGALPIASALSEASPTVLQFKLLVLYLQVASGHITPVQAAQALENYPQPSVLQAHKYYHMGRFYLKAEEIQKAQDAFENAYLLDKSSVFYILALGGLLEQQGNFEKALLIYKDFQSRNPESVLLHKGVHRAQENLPSSPFELSLDRDLAEVMFGFATFMVGQGMDVVAQQLLILTHDADASFPFANLYLGILSEELENPQLALVYYNKVSEQSDAYLAAQLRKAASLKQLGEHKKSKSLLLALKKFYPDLPLLTRMLAEFYYEREAYKASLVYYNELIDRWIDQLPKPQQAMLYFARGSALERLREFEAASDDLLRALEVEPDNPLVLNYLGYMWIDMDQNIDQAFDFIQRALMLRPSDGAIVDSLGWAYYKQGHYDLALKHLERAVELLPDDATVNSHLGDVYLELGRLHEARLQWQRALSFGPDSPKMEAHIKKQLTTYH